jgi:hypothetical protein
MATVTPNFNWPVPTSTDLVKDGATAIEALGDSIDASLVDLKGGTTGQILAKASNTDLDYSWITNDQGDITAVVAGSGIAVTSGTGPVPSVALDLTAANVFTAAQTATALIVTGSTVPANGVYLPAANTLGFSTNSSVRMRIDSVGKIGIGAAPAAGDNIQIGLPITGGTTSHGINMASQIASDVTTAARGYNTFITTAASAFTITTLSHYRASLSSIGAGSAITTQVGFNAESTLVGATNNYGFLGSIAAASGRWNAYMSGTAGNYFAGRVGIGLLLTSTAQFGVTNAQSTTDITVLTRNFAAQTGDSISVQNSASSPVWGVTAAGFMKYISGNTATTVGAAGGASALPLTPTGYLKIDIGGTEFKVPYYAA